MRRNVRKPYKEFLHLYFRGVEATYRTENRETRIPDIRREQI